MSNFGSNTPKRRAELSGYGGDCKRSFSPSIFGSVKMASQRCDSSWRPGCFNTSQNSIDRFGGLSNVKNFTLICSNGSAEKHCENVANASVSYNVCEQPIDTNFPWSFEAYSMSHSQSYDSEYDCRPEALWEGQSGPRTWLQDDGGSKNSHRQSSRMFNCNPSASFRVNCVEEEANAIPEDVNDSVKISPELRGDNHSNNSTHDAARSPMFVGVDDDVPHESGIHTAATTAAIPASIIESFTSEIDDSRYQNLLDTFYAVLNSKEMNERSVTYLDVREMIDDLKSKLMRANSRITKLEEKVCSLELKLEVADDTNANLHKQRKLAEKQRDAMMIERDQANADRDSTKIQSDFLRNALSANDATMNRVDEYIRKSYSVNLALANVCGTVLSIDTEMFKEKTMVNNDIRGMVPLEGSRDIVYPKTSWSLPCLDQCNTIPAEAASIEITSSCDSGMTFSVPSVIEYEPGVEASSAADVEVAGTSSDLIVVNDEELQTNKAKTTRFRVVATNIEISKDNWIMASSCGRFTYCRLRVDHVQTCQLVCGVCLRQFSVEVSLIRHIHRIHDLHTKCKTKDRCFNCTVQISTVSPGKILGPFYKGAERQKCFDQWKIDHIAAGLRDITASVAMSTDD